MSHTTCSSPGCGSKITNPCGHSLCRQHSLCCKKWEGGTFWYRFDCQVCVSFWDSATGRECPEKKSALETLRHWVGGFSKNNKGPYLDTDMSRFVLFPGAKPSSVVDPSVIQAVLGEDISPEAEERLLQGSQDQSAPSTIVEESSQMEVEETHSSHTATSSVPSTSQAPSAEPSFAQTASGLLAQMQSFMTAFQETVKQERAAFQTQSGELKEDIMRSILPVVSAQASSVTALPAADSLPPTAADNPWRVAGGTIQDGLYHITDTSAFKVEKIEFFPSKEAFPACYFRFRTEMLSGNKIPAETVILPLTEASSMISSFVRTQGFKQLETGAMNCGELIFEPPKDVKAPFFAKSLKAVLKSFNEAEKSAFSALKEYKPVTVLAPDSISLVPDVSRISEIFKEGKLKPNCASFQLKETFNKIPSNLINDEFRTRQRLARSMTLQFWAECQLAANPTQKEWSLVAKLNGATFGEHLAAFISAKRRCRSSVLAKASVDMEPNLLIESSPFCRHLFPPDKVAEVLDLARRDNMCLRNRWKMPSIQSSSSDLKKRKFQGRYRRTNKFSRTDTSFRSPATNPLYESKFKSSGYKNQKDNKGGKSTDKTNQPKGRKSFRGKQPKDNTE